jgi:hypothetical protein
MSLGPAIDSSIRNLCRKDRTLSAGIVTYAKQVTKTSEDALNQPTARYEAEAYVWLVGELNIQGEGLRSFAKRQATIARISVSISRVAVSNAVTTNASIFFKTKPSD